MEEEEAAAGARKRKRSGGVKVKQDGAGAGTEEIEVEDCGGGYAKEKEKGLLLDAEEEDGCYEGIAEEAVEDLMRWLEAEIADDALPDPAGFVTINGNEESCGPSFSCAASTVMAAVDTRAGDPTNPPPVPWPFPESAAPAKRDVAEEEEMVGDDEEEAWLADLLACGPALEGV